MKLRGQPAFNESGGARAAGDSEPGLMPERETSPGQSATAGEAADSALLFEGISKSFF